MIDNLINEIEQAMLNVLDNEQSRKYCERCCTANPQSLSW